MPSKRFKSIWKVAVVACLLLVSGATLLAQTTDFADIRPKQNSPLSRFGLGDRLDQHFAAQAGMGGLQSVFQDGYQVNIQNPASLAWLQATSFEVGLYAKLAELADASGAVNTESGNISYLALAFPIRNPINLSLDRQANTWNAGMAFSLAPTTLVGYDLELEEEIEGIGLASNLLRGNGGTYRFTWSNAYRYRGLSVGVNVDYNFGQIENSRVVVFDSVRTALSTELLESFNVSGVTLGYGIQYAYYFRSTDSDDRVVNTGKRILVGVNGKLGGDVGVNTSTTFRRFTNSSGVFVDDVLLSESDADGQLTLPNEINVGLAYEDANRLFLGAEWGTAQWSNFQNDAQPADQLVNTNRMAFGIQYIPNANSYNSWWKRLRYRAGLRLEDDPRVLNGEQARRNAITFGLGMPITLPRQQVSFFNFAVELGKFGVPDVIDENYVQFTLGFSLNDNSWFYKRKFN